MDTIDDTLCSIGLPNITLVDNANRTYRMEHLSTLVQKLHPLYNHPKG